MKEFVKINGRYKPNASNGFGQISKLKSNHSFPGDFFAIYSKGVSYSFANVKTNFDPFVELDSDNYKRLFTSQFYARIGYTYEESKTMKMYDDKISSIVVRMLHNNFVRLMNNPYLKKILISILETRDDSDRPFTKSEIEAKATDAIEKFIDDKIPIKIDKFVHKKITFAGIYEHLLKVPKVKKDFGEQREEEVEGNYDFGEDEDSADAVTDDE
jgi:hypothetical protein